MDEFAERVAASLEGPTAEPWFPGLTADLTARQWCTLNSEIGLTPANYGTARLMTRSLSAPRNIVASLNIPETEDQITIEALPIEATLYEKEGVSLYSSKEILSSSILDCLKDAVAIVSQVSSLMRPIAVLVRSLHVIKPRDDDYDVSFSEPHIPFSIFVSVPKQRTHNDALRVAEAIVHEAMHLQLTLIEQTVSLVVTSSKEFFSPWKGEYRTIRGVLHAVYVFRVIDQFLKAIQDVHPEELSYIKSRRDEIALQFKAIQNFEECSDLTPIGGTLAKTLISDMSECVVQGLSTELSNQHSQQPNSYL